MKVFADHERKAPLRLAVIGLGLVGGSTAAAWRTAGVVHHVSAFDPNPLAGATALSRGVIDIVIPNLVDALTDVDLVLLAAPVGAIVSVLPQLAAILPSQAIVTDVGSTKGAIVEVARSALGSAFRRFVPAHPIAGGELAGVENADASLFDGRLLITTPSDDTSPDALDVVEGAWRRVGARIERMSPATHDRIYAAVSHLPHVLAFTLMAELAQRPDAAQLLKNAGPGFRDFTRIAAGSAPLWRDVALTNREALGAALRQYRLALASIQRAVDGGDAAALESLFALASQARRNWPGDAI